MNTSGNPNLGPCPDCGEMVSVNANACPHCGAALLSIAAQAAELEARKVVAELESTRNKLVFVGVVVIVVFVVGLLIFCIQDGLL